MEKRCHEIGWLLSLGIFATLVTSACGQARGETSRTWVDVQGRTIKAALTNVEGENVVLKLDNGATVNVPLTKLSNADRAYVTNWSARSGAADPTVASKPLTWPQSIRVAGKDLQIVTGAQDAATGRFVYQSGSFQFTSNAPLSGGVVREIAGDFELVSTFFEQMPWGYQAKPGAGKGFFAIELFETPTQYLAAGGADNTTWYHTNKALLVKFDTLGLKRVGERFAFDSRTTRPGSMIGGIVRVVMTDMHSSMNPWAAMGLEYFLEHCAYKNSSFDFVHPERGLKTRIEDIRANGAATDAARMIAFMKTSWRDKRDDAQEIRRQNFVDSMLLVYFFGYLDGDGKGTRLHRFYRELAQRTMAWRQYRESGGTRPAPPGNAAEIPGELNKLVMDGRSEEQLRQEVIAKYKGIGVKL